MLRVALAASLWLGFVSLSQTAELREPVHPRRNVDEFSPTLARFLRFTIHNTNMGEPGIDELEIYGPGNPQRNLGLAANGARATSSGSLAGYRIHQLDGVNDGQYGNGHCWIADRRENAWVQIELPTNTLIQKVIWSRDREGKFIDRVPTHYAIEAKNERGEWLRVASSDDRKPRSTNAVLGLSPVARQFVNGFAPASTALSPESERSSSEYTIDSWQTSDGLPANTVTAIAQTTNGYLWIGTLNGLARFDGICFKNFNKPEGLPNSRVLCLLLDHSGALWIGTDGGLARFAQEKFRTFTTRDGLPNESVSSLAEDDRHRIWVGTAEGLACFQDDKFQRDPSQVPRQRVRFSRLLSEKDRLWATENGGVFIVENGRVNQPDITGEPSRFSSMFALHRGPAGKLWFGGANHYLSCLSNDVLIVYPEQRGQLLDSIWEILETRTGDVWVGTASGGLRRLRDGRFTSLTTQEGLSDNSIRCLFEDREDNLWVGTIGGGLNRIKPKRVTTYTTRDGLSHNVIMSLAEDKEGTLWIGSNCGGLNTRRNGTIQPFTTTGLLDNECIWSLLSAGDGSVWVGTWGGGLYRVRGYDVSQFPFPRPAQDQPVVAICEDLEGDLWFGTYGGGVRYFKDGTVTTLGTNSGLAANFITAIEPDSSGEIWIGTAGAGLNRIDCGPAKEAVKPALFTRQHGLPNEFIRTIRCDSLGVTWVGTDGGLGRFAEGKFAAFGKSQGLPNEVISQILEDDRGNLWLGSNRGIFSVARRELEQVAAGQRATVDAVTYGRADGMESAQCTGGFHPAGLRTKDGKLWFSTVKGLVMVDPNRIQSNPLPPTVLIEEVRLEPSAGAPVTPVTDPNTLQKLSHRTGRLEFRFTATSLLAAERNRFRHRLEGLERQWVEDDNQRVAAYYQLPPGKYRFHVSACNADGVWNELGASLNLRVLPPFWQTWWFTALGGLAVIGGGGSTVRYWSVRRLRHKLAALEQQHALEKERARIARDIHDELGANLTRITLLTELGQKHQARPEEVAADLTKISATAREAVRAMDAIVWAVNPRNDSLDHFANYVSLFAEDFLRLTPIRCRLDIPANLPERFLSTEARHELFLAVKEALNNVVRHSRADEVWLRMRCDAAELQITVEDNGKGLPQAQALAAGKDQGHDGLLNIQNRVKKLGGTVVFQSGPARGTRLLIKVPMKASTGSAPSRSASQFVEPGSSAPPEGA
jgi:ligand-binding sensor domain-containing protein/signal transduction histidine kinase